MHEITITISDQSYAAAVERARREGFSDVSGLLASLLDEHDLLDPQRLSRLDQAVAEARERGSHSLEEVDAHFGANREAWIEKALR